MVNANKTVRFGLSNVHFSIYDEITKKYGTPEAIPGAVKMTLTKVGESDTFYADNIPYATFESNGGYIADLEVAAAADDFYVKVLGMTKDSQGLIIESADDAPVKFALMYEVSSNTEPQRFVFYSVQASRPELEHNTKADSTEPDTTTLALTMATQAFTVGGTEREVVKAHLTKTADTATAYAGFFNAVMTPATE